MPVVPITKGTQSQPQAMPSETNMLMAIADMHKQGRFDVAANLQGQGTNKDGPYLSDSGWSTLSEKEQKDLEDKSAKIYTDDFDNNEQLHEIIKKNGAIEIDPRAAKVQDFLRNAPPGIERYNYKGNPDRTIFLRQKEALTS